MKKTIQLGLLLMLVVTVFVSPLLAQNVQKEMQNLAKQYEQAYNKKDYKTLQAMYTKNATRTDANGKVENGNKAIGVALAEEFNVQDGTILTLMPDKIQTSSDGAVSATGSYRVKGKSKQSGEAFDVKGTYSNTLVKEGKKWKISKNVLAAR